MKRLITLMLVGGLAIAPLTYAKPHGEEFGFNPHMLRDLELSAEQRDTIRQLFQTSRDNNSIYRGDRKQLRHDMHAWIDSQTGDVEALSVELANQYQTMQPMQIERAKTRNAIWNILTTEQQQALQTKMAENMAARISRPDREADFSALSLTAEQAQQLADWQTTNESIRSSHQAAQRAFRAQEKAVIQQSSFDETAYISLLNEYQDDFVAAGVAKAQQRLMLETILTDEQIDTLREQRQALWEGEHRGHKGPKRSRG